MPLSTTELLPVGLIVVRCRQCNQTVGEAAPVPGLYNVYHCKRCGRWIDFCIPPAHVLRLALAAAEAGAA